MITPPKQQPYKNILLIITTTCLLFGVGFLINRNLYQQQKSNVAEVTQVDPSTESQPADFSETTISEIEALASLAITVPFTPQAPTANWDELHNEACEEASAIMVNAYFSGIDTLPAPYVESQIEMLTEWQNKNYGYHLSIDTAETANMIEEVYGLKTTTVSISEKAIKQALVADKIVIIPTNGQLLKNPFYKPPGPLYHMLVITGYTETEFISNDPGTRRGLNYNYTYETLYESTGNWVHNDSMVDLTDKKIIIVSKK